MMCYFRYLNLILCEHSIYVFGSNNYPITTTREVCICVLVQKYILLVLYLRYLILSLIFKYSRKK